MRTHLVSYADGDPVHERNRQALLHSAAGKGLDVLRSYRRHDLSEAFRRAHRHILDEPRGAGFWLWKPYVIDDSLRQVDEGDVVVYLDAGILIRRALDPLIACTEHEDLLLIARPSYESNAHYVKRDCFVLTGTDSPECHATTQLDASVLLIKNTATNRRFIRAWLDQCTDDRVLTDKPNESGRPNLPGFVSHRRDQAVLSVLWWRERAALPHAVVEASLKADSLWHHRRRVPFVPIAVWMRTPYVLRRVLVSCRVRSRRLLGGQRDVRGSGQSTPPLAGPGRAR